MKYLLFLLLDFHVAAADSATIYRGRVQYASTGKPLKNVVVEARMHPAPHILFFVPRTFAVVATTSSGPTGRSSLPFLRAVDVFTLWRRARCAKSARNCLL